MVGGIIDLTFKKSWVWDLIITNALNIILVSYSDPLSSKIKRLIFYAYCKAAVFLNAHLDYTTVGIWNLTIQNPETLTSGFFEGQISNGQVFKGWTIAIL